MATPAELIQAFVSRTGPLAFSNVFGASAATHADRRQTFAKSLRERVEDPGKISQASTMLCGPAAFMFCVAKKRPDAYVSYAIELAEKGAAKIGKFQVSPSTECRNTSLASSTIDPVDWVTLAGLRDSANHMLHMDSTDGKARAMTPPGHIVWWFYFSELFKDVIDNTNLVFNKKLSDMVQAEQRRAAGYFVCLFVGSTGLGTAIGNDKIPDHWIVLTNELRVGGDTTAWLSSLGRSIDTDKTLNKKQIAFEAYTWGESRAHVPTSRARPLTVDNFLRYFWGYVCAK
ncbi:MAG TPA: hypothetical protein VJV78_14735 [Polyangiales bacterium]|nr:hypothetical protein [Polyangiales bacterium]